MDKVIDLVGNSLEYYDNNYEKYSELYHKIKYIKINNKGENNEYFIELFDENKKLILKSRYEILGTYISKSSTWIWAWAYPDFQKKLTNISRKLLHYGTELDPDKQSLYLKTELITSRYKISNKIQLDIHTSIASYLSKQPLIYKYNFYDVPVKYKETDIKEDIQLLDVTPPADKKDINYITYYLFLLDYNNYKV